LGRLEGAVAGPKTHSGEAVSETVRRGRLAPGAEDFATLQARLVAGYEAICAQHAGRTVAVVSHGGALRTLIAWLLELPPERIDRLSLRGNTSVSEIDFRNGRPQLSLLNCTRHLD
jgi:broad specificity phosphatase PhoE